MEQLDIFPVAGTPITEKGVYKSLEPSLLAVLDYNNIEHKLLSFSKKKDYSSVTFLKSLLFRLYFRADLAQISISDSYSKLVPPDLSVSVNPKDSKFLFIQFPRQTDILNHLDFFTAILQSVIDRIPKEFDCCSSYMACSDERRCVTPNKELALGCGYKKVLRRGLVFYGKNRNID